MPKDTRATSHVVRSLSSQYARLPPEVIKIEFDAPRSSFADLPSRSSHARAAGAAARRTWSAKRPGAPWKHLAHDSNIVRGNIREGAATTVKDRPSSSSASRSAPGAPPSASSSFITARDVNRLYESGTIKRRVRSAPRERPNPYHSTTLLSAQQRHRYDRQEEVGGDTGEAEHVAETDTHASLTENVVDEETQEGGGGEATALTTHSVPAVDRWSLKERRRREEDIKVRQRRLRLAHSLAQRSATGTHRDTRSPWKGGGTDQSVHPTRLRLWADESVQDREVRKALSRVVVSLVSSVFSLPLCL